MNLQPDLIHERRDRKMMPFYWIITFECLSVLLLIALALAGFPAYWALKYKGWAYLLLLFTALGLWLTRISIRLLVKYVWENNHLNHYKLYQDRIEYIQYDKKKREAFEDTIYLGEIERIYIGRYFAMYHYAYRKASLVESQPLADTLPCLKIVYSKGGGRNVVEIPFYEPEDVDIWLHKLSELGIPYLVSAVYLHNLNKEQRLQSLDHPDHSFPYAYEAPFRKQEYQQLLLRIDQYANEHTLKQREANGGTSSSAVVQTPSSSGGRSGTR